MITILYQSGKVRTTFLRVSSILVLAEFHNFATIGGGSDAGLDGRNYF